MEDQASRLHSPPTIACQSSFLALSPLYFLHSPRLLHSKLSNFLFFYSSKSRFPKYCSQGQVGDCCEKNRQQHSCLASFYIFFFFSPTDWGIFLNYAYLFILPKNSFKAVKAVVNFLSLMFQRNLLCLFHSVQK